MSCWRQLSLWLEAAEYVAVIQHTWTLIIVCDSERWTSRSWYGLEDSGAQACLLFLWFGRMLWWIQNSLLFCWTRKRRSAGSWHVHGCFLQVWTCLMMDRILEAHIMLVIIYDRIIEAHVVTGQRWTRGAGGSWISCCSLTYMEICIW